MNGRNRPLAWEYMVWILNSGREGRGRFIKASNGIEHLICVRKGSKYFVIFLETRTVRQKWLSNLATDKKNHGGRI